jgi:2-polyprenyl-3-methyl-5-hydroxy-6-metoxy-1,4-benzoquinol methylase
MNIISNFGVNLAKHLRYWLWRRWRGFGRPNSLETWQKQYVTGQWDYLNSLAELDHYSVIVGYVRHFFDKPDILDIGCGHGRLLELLHPSWFRHYTGIDYCREAIVRSNRLNQSGVSFIAGDFETWRPLGPADVIIFNEVLYYAQDPLALVARYIPSLGACGKIIVSMHDSDNHNAIWRRLDAILHCVHGVSLHTVHSQRWNVRVFVPLTETEPGS